jgi:hypothetical protein
MRLRAVAIPDNRVQPDPILGREGDRYSFAHRAESHDAAPQGIPYGVFRQVLSTKQDSHGLPTNGRIWS